MKRGSENEGRSKKDSLYYQHFVQKKKKKNFVFKFKEVFRLIHKKLSVFQLYKNGSFTYFN